MSLRPGNRSPCRVKKKAVGGLEVIVSFFLRLCSKCVKGRKSNRVSTQCGCLSCYTDNRVIKRLKYRGTVNLQKYKDRLSTPCYSQVT